ncbi:MAG: transposase [Acidobacteriota bacterium]|nr:MAG: transposase [Acidobacteriota bacterium]
MKERPALQWHSRGYLPHFDGIEITQTVTFRLYDSLPQSLIRRWQEEIKRMPEELRDLERRKRIEACLDKGIGSCFLSKPEIARTVENALLFHDNQRYRLHAWVIMPNHVHTLFTPMPEFTLSQILHTWKSFTALQCNRILVRKGEFWQRESYDRYIRNGKHFAKAQEYIENNPVKAGLCPLPEDWRWSSAYRNGSAPGSAGILPA